MIIGHGIDLIDIRRIDRTIDRFGERFIKRIFTKNERIRSDKKQKRFKQEKIILLFCMKDLKNLLQLVVRTIFLYQLPMIIHGLRQMSLLR